MLNTEKQILNVECKNLNCHKLIWIFCTAAGVGPFVTNVNRWRKSGTPLILIPQNFPIQRPTCDEADDDKNQRKIGPKLKAKKIPHPSNFPIERPTCDDKEENDESGHPYLILEITEFCFSNPCSKMKIYYFCQEFMPDQMPQRSQVDSIAVSLFTNSEFVNRETAMLSSHKSLGYLLKGVL